MTLEEMITENNDWGKKKFLKLDCEGCEWDSLDQMDDKVLLEFE